MTYACSLFCLNGFPLIYAVRRRFRLICSLTVRRGIAIPVLRRVVCPVSDSLDVWKPAPAIPCPPPEVCFTFLGFVFIPNACLTTRAMFGDSASSSPLLVPSGFFLFPASPTRFRNPNRDWPACNTPAFTRFAFPPWGCYLGVPLSSVVGHWDRMEKRACR